MCNEEYKHRPSTQDVAHYTSPDQEGNCAIRGTMGSLQPAALSNQGPKLHLTSLLCIDGTSNKDTGEATIMGVAYNAVGTDHKSF